MLLISLSVEYVVNISSKHGYLVSNRKNLTKTSDTFGDNWYS